MRLLAIDPGTTESGNEMTDRRKAQIKAAQARYKSKNRDLLNAKSRARRESNLELYAAMQRDYRRRKPEVMRAIESRRNRPAEQREAFHAYRRQWAKKNPDKVREYAHKRSGVRLAKLPRGTIKRIGIGQKWMCAYCSADLMSSGYHKDHIVPLARGGKHDPSNIQLLCPRCNLAKGSKDPIEFMQERGLLL